MEWSTNAIESLFRSKALNGTVDYSHPVVVHTRPLPNVAFTPLGHFRKVILYDGRDHVHAMIKMLNTVGNLSDYAISMVPCTIRIEGYIVSVANYGLLDPVMFITKYATLKHNHPLPDTITSQPNFFRPKNDANFGGFTSAFLADWASRLSVDELSGSNDFCLYKMMSKQNFQGHCESLDKRKAIVTSLSKHDAMINFHNSMINIGKDDTPISTDSYLGSLAEFRRSQMDRQMASLVTNSGRETAERATQIESQYITTLERALLDSENKEKLTPETLCSWHSILCGGGLVSSDNVGRFRQINVRTGNTHYCHYNQVYNEIQRVCTAIDCFENNFLYVNNKKKDDSAEPETKKGKIASSHSSCSLEKTIVFGAIVFMGIVDLHPFTDGNGRLSRISLNWALKRAGFPFVIQLHATPIQRTELIQSIQLTRHNISLVARGNVQSDDILQCYKISGALGPIVELILDRIYKAIIEFEKVVTVKTSLRLEADEARVARKHREEAAKGTCLICLDDQPNIATLCCGNAVHLNCMAEWLSSKSVCPICQAALPKLQNRRERPGDNPTAEHDEDTEASVFDIIRRFGIAPDNDENNDETTDEVDNRPPVCSYTGCQNRSAWGCSSSACARCCNNVHCRRHSTLALQNNQTTTEEEQGGEETTFVDNGTTFPDNGTAEEEAETTTVIHNNNGNYNNNRGNDQPKCFNCQNLSANDCSNTGCGRCCVLYGQYTCDRHTSFNMHSLQ